MFIEQKLITFLNKIKSQKTRGKEFIFVYKMTDNLILGNKEVGLGKSVFIIAEIGVNHILKKEDMKKLNLESSLEVAFKMIDEAKKSGVDAVKFQSFSADKLQFKGTKKPKYQLENVGNDDEVSYIDMIRRLETSKEDQLKISQYCKEKNIIFFSTPYDNESVDFLDKEVDVPFFKLASIDLNNHLFFKYVAKKKKPIIISTGLSELENVKEIVEIAKEEGIVDKLIILQCTSNYPTLPEDINLNVLNTYKEEFPDVLFGFSDHSPTDIASIGAVSIGACVLEKHFTLNKEFVGPDHSSSLNSKELTSWVKNIKEIETSMGSYEKKVTDVEKNNSSMRKYLVIKEIKAGEAITEKHLVAMRTGDGVLPIEKNLDNIVGKKVKININDKQIFEWSMVN